MSQLGPGSGSAFLNYSGFPWHWTEQRCWLWDWKYGDSEITFTVHKLCVCLYFGTQGFYIFTSSLSIHYCFKINHLCSVNDVSLFSCWSHCGPCWFIIVSAMWFLFLFLFFFTFKSVCERDRDWPLILLCSSTHSKWQTSTASPMVCLYNTLFSFSRFPLALFPTTFDLRFIS